MSFERQNGFIDDKFSAGPFFAVILIFGFAAIVFFDQLAMVRLHRKMYPPKVVDRPAADEPAAKNLS